MTLKDLIERRSAVEADMRGLYDAAEAANEDLTGEKLDKWNTLKSELDDLKGKEARARERDALDRKADGKPVGQRGDANGETVFGLTHEQRLADYQKATTGQDASGLSVGRAVCGMVTGSWEGAEAERRIMGTSPGAVGGFLMPEPISANVIDLARNRAVLVQAGALTIPMASKNLRIVQIVTDPTAQWRGEGQEIDESDGEFAALNLTAHSLAALVRVNAELLDDVPMFAATLDMQLAAALALKLDYAGLYGTGAGMPLGLRGTPGVNEQSMGDNGAVPTDYDKFLDLIAAIETSNGSPDTLVWAPRDKNTMAKLVTGITSDKTKLALPADFAALRKLVSNQVSITETQGSATGVCSSAFMGGFSNMALAIRQNITIEASRQAGDTFAKNQVHVRAIMRADVAVYRPNQFGRLIGIKVS
jgi:HK97 family phage major capsid protein